MYGQIQVNYARNQIWCSTRFCVRSYSFLNYVNDLPLHIPDLCELFCDDTTIHTSHHDLPSVFKSLQNCIDKLTKWSHYNHMSLNPHKTKLMVIATIQKRQNITTELPTLCIAEEPVEIVDSHRVLGVMIDNNLSWHSHVNYMCKTLTKKVYQLCRIKHFLSPHARRLFFHAHILSCTVIAQPYLTLPVKIQQNL